MTTTPTAPILQARILLPVTLTVDLSRGTGALMAASIPEHLREAFLSESLVNMVETLFERANVSPEPEGPSATIGLGPRAMFMASGMVELDRETGDQILSPEQEMAQAALAVLLDPEGAGA